MTLSQGNLTLENMTLISTSKAAAEAEKLEVTYADGFVHAKIKDPGNAPKAGTYTYSYKGNLTDGTPVSGGTLKITVSADLPKVKLSATSVKLNQYLAGAEHAEITPIITGGTGYTLVGFAGLDANRLSFSGGRLSVHLTGAEKAGSRYTFQLKPIFRLNGTGQEVTLPTALTLTVQVYRSENLGVSLSAKGKLDTLNPDSAIDYTVTRLTNCAGSVEGVALTGQDADRFRAELDNTGTKPVIRLTKKDGAAYATNVTYQVRFRLTFCGKTVLSPVMRIKVSQSTVKLTAAPATLTLFQSQSAPLTGKLTLTAPAGAEIAPIALSDRTSAELKAALDMDDFAISGNTAALSLRIKNSGLLKAGKSYYLYLDVTPRGNAENCKPTQAKLTVKVLK